MKAQRLRFRYRLTPEAGALSNRDLARVWDEALERTGYAVARSEGKRPGPLIALAAPLPLGVTSDCELVDVFLSLPADPRRVLAALKEGVAPGIEPLTVEEVGVDAPSLQSQMRWAEYEVCLASDLDAAQGAADRLLAAVTFPVEFQRGDRVKKFDLRPLIIDMEPGDGCHEGTLLRMRLRAAPENAARADQVLLALGLPAAGRVHRTRLELEQVPTAVLAYRRRGSPAENGTA